MSQSPSVAVYGLSGDPSQNGHVGIVRALVTSGRFDGVVVVPCGARPEATKRGLAPSVHRLAMAHLAFDALGTMTTWVIVDEEDVHQPNFTPHIELLERQAAVRSANVVAVIGADLVVAKPELGGRCELDGWAQAERLKQNWDMVVFPREGLPDGSVLRIPPRGTLLEGPLLQEVSSTEIRSRIAFGLPIDHLVPTSVARYIRDLGLYR